MQSTPLEQEYLGVFVEATQELFRTMLGCETTTVGVDESSESVAYDISGLVGLAGEVKGVVSLRMPTPVALASTEALLGDRHTELDNTVRDTISELSNIVVGSAKSSLATHFDVNITLPNVISGPDHHIILPRGVTLATFAFRTPWGPFCVETGLVRSLELASV